MVKSKNFKDVQAMKLTKSTDDLTVRRMFQLLKQESLEM